ncbi:hypothetical protein JCM11641_002945 [Rhodosporidiobolus odoratus]
MLAAAALAASLAVGVYAAPVAQLATVEAALSPSNTTHHNASVVDYKMNGNNGACGWYSKDSALVAGLPLEQYTDLASASPFCGQYIVVVDPRNNKTVTALVADASTQRNTLSLSQGSFSALNGTDSDLKYVDWRFANETETADAKDALSSSSSDSASSSTTEYYAAKSSYSSWTAPSSSSSPAAAQEYQEKKQSSTTSYKPTTSYAPKTTTTSYAPKATTTTQAEVAATKQASSYKSSGSSSGSHSGTATYFYQNGVAGACGSVNSDSAYIVALQTSMYSGGSHCGQSIKVNGNGNTITVKVADECPTCESSGSIDLSEAAFKALAGLDAGVASVTWDWA